MDPRIIKKRKLEIEIDDGDHTEARRSEEVGVLSEKKRKMEGEGGDEPRGTDRQDRLVSEDGKGRAIGIDIMGTNNKVLEKGKGEDRPRVVGNGTARLEGSVVPSKTGECIIAKRRTHKKKLEMPLRSVRNCPCSSTRRIGCYI